MGAIYNHEREAFMFLYILCDVKFSASLKWLRRAAANHVHRFTARHISLTDFQFGTVLLKEEVRRYLNTLLL